MNHSQKLAIRKSFAKASSHYDDYAHLQRLAADTLMTEYPQHWGGSVMDLGAGTGYLGRRLLSEFPDISLLSLDCALPMLQQARNNLPGHGKQALVCADAECLPFAAACFDFIASNLAMQWCEDLTRTLTALHALLKPDGRLLFTSMGRGTLTELRQTWEQIDGFTHVNQFGSAEDLERIVSKMAWRHWQVRSKLFQLRYPSVDALMRELKGIGAHQITTGRSKQLRGKSVFRLLEEIYPRLPGEVAIQASYEVILVEARK